ncbi:hypothetical protein OGATHE_004378 [Ogataea polymorpha]|uniref:Uncharacterized protein n=1 Tax=Ogataea polymorpha TaxID=460523 RepID=A0A9P8P0X0_9ASCO|nr:hypothetical protein OGATHE_004378 [Ogataea polymorpha]
MSSGRSSLSDRSDGSWTVDFELSELLISDETVANELLRLTPDGIELSDADGYSLGDTDGVWSGVPSGVAWRWCKDGA